MDEITTTDLAKFGRRELKLAAELLTALTSQGAPDGLGDGITMMMNRNSGNVFLTDEDYAVAMMNGDDLELWHSCPECGEEGFREELEGFDEHYFDEYGQLQHGEAPDEDDDE